MLLGDGNFVTVLEVSLVQGDEAVYDPEVGCKLESEVGKLGILVHIMEGGTGEFTGMPELL